MLKKLLNPDKTSGFFKVVNTTKLQLGRIRSSIYGEPFSEPAVAHLTSPASLDQESKLGTTMQSGKKVFFFHPMKTGGVTFRGILSSVYGNAFQVCYDPTADAIETSLATTQAMEFHSFHFKGQLAHMHSGLTSNDRWDILEGQHCFTLLREPVDQVVSLYYHMVRRRLFIEPSYKAHGWHFPETLEEFIDDEFHFNTQAGFLADNHRAGDGSAPGLADLERAKTTLTRLKMHVGLTERFGDSMNVFEHVTGLEIPGGVIRNENRNTSRVPVEAISPKLRDRIRENSALDIELYQFGREMFLEDFSQVKVRRTYIFQTSERGDQAVVQATASRPSVAAASQTSEAAATAQSDVARKVVFLHSLQTGGMAYRWMLSSIYDDKFHIVDNPEIESVAKSLKSFDCIEFHVQSFEGAPTCMHTNLAKQRRWDVLQGSDVFTLFRNPVDHVVSQYNYLQSHRTSTEPIYRASGMKFPETIEQYLDNPIHLNSQLAFLVGKNRTKSGPDVTSADLDDAKEMLIKLNVHPGITERFAESVHIFETITGRQVPRGELVRDNQYLTGTHQHVISTQTKDRIRDLSALDRALYQFAFDLFMKDVAQSGQTRQYSFVDGDKSVLATA